MTHPRLTFALTTLVCSLASPLALSAPATQPITGLDAFNYIVGTETFNASYQFTHQAPLVETAERIRAMGSTVLKFQMDRRYKEDDGPYVPPEVHTLTELAQKDEAHKHILDMPFKYYVIWTHTLTGGGDSSWRNGLLKENAANEYKEMYDFASYLLKTYSGTGKVFYLGHWEGDGWLRGNIRRESDAHATPEAIQGFIDWLNVRQKAIDDAKRDTPHHDVQLWHYTEVNHVALAMNEGRPAVVNKVLPHTHVDYVSYSSYDTMKHPEELKKALSYIESQLPPKDGLPPGKRVWIGEYGFDARRSGPAKQEEMSRAVMKAGLEWGCPFILYWEMYNNEVDDQGQRGFWLIDDHNVKQPIYYTLESLLQDARKWVADYQKQHGRMPSETEYRQHALEWLAKR